MSEPPLTGTPLTGAPRTEPPLTGAPRTGAPLTEPPLAEEPPPFGGSWRVLYTIVLLNLAVQIVLFYVFTKAFQRTLP